MELQFKQLSREERLQQGTFYKYGAILSVIPMVFDDSPEVQDLIDVNKAGSMRGTWMALRERGRDDYGVYKLFRDGWDYTHEEIMREVPEMSPEAVQKYCLMNDEPTPQMVDMSDEVRKKNKQLMEELTSASVTVSNDGYIMNTETPITPKNENEYAKYQDAQNPNELRKEGTGYSASEKRDEQERD